MMNDIIQTQYERSKYKVFRHIFCIIPVRFPIHAKKWVHNETSHCKLCIGIQRNIRIDKQNKNIRITTYTYPGDFHEKVHAPIRLPTSWTSHLKFASDFDIPFLYHCLWHFHMKQIERTKTSAKVNMINDQNHWRWHNEPHQEILYAKQLQVSSLQNPCHKGDIYQKTNIQFSGERSM